MWLSSSKLAKARVKKRVKEGGHSIPGEVIERRFEKGVKNLLSFLKLADEWLVLDNSSGDYIPIAKKDAGYPEIIYNLDLWEKLKK